MKLMLPRITTLSRRFMLGVVPVSLAGMLLLGASAFYYTKLHITKSVEKEMDTFSKGAAASVGAFFRQRENDIAALSETSLLADYYNNVDYGLSEEAGQYRRELERYFKQFSGRAKVYNRVYFADARGGTICGIQNLKPMAAGGQTAAAGMIRQAAAANGAGGRMSPVAVDPLYGPVITYVKPVFDELRNVRGVMVLEASLKPLQNILGRLRVGNSGKAFITDSTDRPVLAWTDGYEAWPVSRDDFTARERIPHGTPHSAGRAHERFPGPAYQHQQGYGVPGAFLRAAGLGLYLFHDPRNDAARGKAGPGDALSSRRAGI